MYDEDDDLKLPRKGKAKKDLKPLRKRAVKPILFSEVARDILRSKSVEVNMIMVDPISGAERTRQIKYTSDKNIAYSIASVMILKALSGDSVATSIILDRTEGKAPENLAPPQNEDEERIEYDIRERLYNEDDTSNTNNS